MGVHLFGYCKNKPGKEIVFLYLGKNLVFHPRKNYFSGSMTKTTKGQILVGNESGFYAFFPEELDVDMKPLKLVITDFFFNKGSGLTG